MVRVSVVTLTATILMVLISLTSSFMLPSAVLRRATFRRTRCKQGPTLEPSLRGGRAQSISMVAQDADPTNFGRREALGVTGKAAAAALLSTAISASAEKGISAMGNVLVVSIASMSLRATLLLKEIEATCSNSHSCINPGYCLDLL